MAKAMERRLEWLQAARPDQLPPEGDWEIWMLLGGRGSGKTRTGAEETVWRVVRNPGWRWAVVAPTESDIRDVCFEGDSGILSVLPPSLYIKGGYVRSLAELTLANGSIIKGYSSVKPERLRGPQHHGAWCDELFAWENLEETLDMLNFGLRLGSHPQKIFTSTPKPVPLVRKLDKMSKEPNSKVIIARSSTYDNSANLAKGFFDQVSQYEGTQLGRQELHAEIIDPEESGIIKRSWIKLWPAKKPLPRLDYVIVSLDTAFTERTFDTKSKQPDPTACTVWGIFVNPLTRTRDCVLLDAWDGMYGLPDLLEKAKEEMNKRYGEVDRPIVQPKYGANYSYSTRSAKRPDLMIIEDKGSGISLRQFLTRLGTPVYKYNPGRASKLERLHLVSHWINAGRMWVVESDRHPNQPRTWAQPMIEQLCSYHGPGTTYHDDWIDSVTQFLRYAGDRGLFNPLSDVSDKDTSQPVRNVVNFPSSALKRNPYDT